MALRYEGRLKVAFFCGLVEETEIRIIGFIDSLHSSLAPTLDKLAEYAEECEKQRKVFSLYKAYKIMTETSPPKVVLELDDENGLEIYVDDNHVGEDSEPWVVVSLEVDKFPEAEKWRPFFQKKKDQPNHTQPCRNE